MSKYHVLRIRNRGVGTYIYYKPLQALCHICFTTDAELHRCQHCYKLACTDHYNLEFQVCTDCLQYYRNAEGEKS